MALENVTADQLRQVLAKVDESAAAERLMAAITYLEIDDVSQKQAAEMYGFSEGWASKWFNRLERLDTEPFEVVVCDEPRSGRPSELSEEQKQQFTDVVQKSPENVGIDAPAWSVPLARNYLMEKFGVEYSNRHVRRLLREAGLSWKTARPEFYKSDERAQEVWKVGFKKSATAWTTNTRSSQ